MLSVVVGLGEVVCVPRPVLVVDPSDKLHLDTGSNDLHPEVKEKTVYTPSTDQVELRQIRLRLKLTKQAYANALGIKQCTLDSYEYGKTKGVPSVLMASARDLEKKQESSSLIKIESLENRQMSDILDEWASKLNVPVNNASVLGRLLDATPTTIRRWRDNKVRPDVGRLVMLSSIVESGPEGAKKAIALNVLKKLKIDSASTDGVSFIPFGKYEECIEKLNDAFSESDRGKALLEEFKNAVASSHKTEGRKAFIQMNTFSFHRFIKRFSLELTLSDDGGVDA